ncbi:MAG: hypothetical protein RR355_01975 [Oscillospiraceae bacterium]
MKKRNYFFVITSIVLFVWLLLSILFNSLNFNYFNLPRVLYIIFVVVFNFCSVGEAYLGRIPLVIALIAIFAIIGSILMKNLKKPIRRMFYLFPLISIVSIILLGIHSLIFPSNFFLLVLSLTISAISLVCWFSLNVYILSHPKNAIN